MGTPILMFLCVGTAIALAGADTSSLLQDQVLARREGSGVALRKAFAAFMKPKLAKMRKVSWRVQKLEPGTSIETSMGGPGACDYVVTGVSRGTCSVPKKFDLREMRWVFRLARPIDAGAEVNSSTTAKAFLVNTRFNVACGACDASCHMTSSFKPLRSSIGPFNMPACSDNTTYTMDVMKGWTKQPPMIGELHIRYEFKRADGTTVAKGYIKL